MREGKIRWLVNEIANEVRNSKEVSLASLAFKYNVSLKTLRYEIVPIITELFDDIYFDKDEKKLKVRG